LFTIFAKARYREINEKSIVINPNQGYYDLQIHLSPGETMNRKSLTSFFAAVLLLAVSGTGAVAQSTQSATADKFIISARAGGINYVQGSVAVARTNGRGGTLIRGDRLEIGDRASTNSISRAEVLLNPGSYLRLGPDSEFEFLTTDLDDLQLKLYRGTAMLEVFATNDFRVTVVTPNGRVALIESGVYRIDLRANGSGTIAVIEGKAELGDRNATIVKSGRMASIGGPANIATFDRKNRDEMAEWSRTRGKELAKATASLKQKDIRGSLLSSFSNNSWGFHDSFGLWIFNAAYGGYCFLPFGNRWYSPYGYRLGYGMDWRHFYLNYRPPTTVAGGGGSTIYPRPKPDGPPPGKVRRMAGDGLPPFREIEKSGGRGTVVGNSDGGWTNQGGSRGGFDRAPSPPVQVQAPPPVQQIDPVSAGVRKSSPID
jgi:hypothetical protein